MPVYTGDPSYRQLLRCKVTIMDNSQTNVLYYFDGFDPYAITTTMRLNHLHVHLEQFNNGTFDFTIYEPNPNNKMIDLSLLKARGMFIKIELGKTSQTCKNVLMGFNTKRGVTIGTNKIEYTVSGYGFMVRGDERLTDFDRSAPLDEFGGTGSARFDKSMTASDLIRRLWTDPNHLPFGGPLETGFDTDGIDDNVNDFIASIKQKGVTWNTVGNEIADLVGADYYFAFDGARPNLTFRYPSTVHSGIIITSNETATDLADRISYIKNEWSFEDSGDVGDGFANRLNARLGTDRIIDSSSPTGSVSDDAFTSMFNTDLATQFIPGSSQLKNLVLILSKTISSTGTGDILGDERFVTFRVLLDENNAPTGEKVATLQVPIIDIEENKATPIYNTKMTLHTDQIQVDKKHWIAGYAIGTSADDTINWHHDNDTLSANRYSAFRQVVFHNQDDRTPNKKSRLGWNVSTTGPVYHYAIFSPEEYLIEASDPESIATYGLVENNIDDATFIVEAETTDRFMMAQLSLRAKPKRTYNIGEVTIPNNKLFLPGFLVTVRDNLSGLNDSLNTMAVIHSVDYELNADGDQFGALTCSIDVLGYADFNASNTKDTVI